MLLLINENSDLSIDKFFTTNTQTAIKIKTYINMDDIKTKMAIL